MKIGHAVYLRQILTLRYSYDEMLKLYEGILIILNNGIFVDRNMYVETSNKWISALGECERYDIALIRYIKDSSTHYSFFLMIHLLKTNST